MRTIRAEGHGVACRWSTSGHKSRLECETPVVKVPKAPLASSPTLIGRTYLGYGAPQIQEYDIRHRSASTIVDDHSGRYFQKYTNALEVSSALWMA